MRLFEIDILTRIFELMGSISRLSALGVKRMTRPGFYCDGAGLYLQIARGGSKSWVFKYCLDGRKRQMGLGGLNAISLAEARELATAARSLKARGIDPIDARQEQRRERRLERAKAVTFAHAAQAYIEANRAGWKNSKHAEQWSVTIATYVAPVMGRISVADIDTGLVLKAIEPIWKSKPETASRVRGRIEAILDWAKVRGYREGENPARWRGHLQKLLPAKTKVRAVQHHKALPFRQMPEFMGALRSQSGTAPLALEFAILTAARTGEVIGATWAEIDLDQQIWTIPAGRMKAAKEHRVPLSPRALEILELMLTRRCAEDLSLRRSATGSHEAPVFPGQRAGDGLSNMSLLAVLKRMARTDLTVHGFRSSFRDWAAEETDFPAEVVEMALAHTINNKVEAAYRRGELIEKRRSLMTSWSLAIGA